VLMSAWAAVVRNSLEEKIIIIKLEIATIPLFPFVSY